MKFKKLLTVVLVAATLGSALIGCGSSNNSNENSSDDGSSKITLMSTDTSFGDKFTEYIKEAEKAIGLEIEVIEAPTNSSDRIAKTTTILSSGDTSVDILTMDDEMLTAFKNTGYLEPLQDTVMTKDVSAQFQPEYMKEIVTSGDNIYSVPMFMEILALWVDQQKIEAAGLETIETKEDFIKYVEANTKDGKYGYGGAWEKTFVYNEIGTFINLFGGDYYDWTNPKTKEAVKFLYDMMKNGQTPKAQMADQYDPMMQKFFDGDYASIFMYTGGISKFIETGNYGPEGFHISQMPIFENNTAYMASWHYVMNAASENKEEANKFLSWAASSEGELAYFDATSRMPARTDVLNEESFKADGLEDIRGYIENTELHGRPMASQSMEFISAIGSLFQQYISDEISLDDFCDKAQKEVDTYITQ